MSKVNLILSVNGNNQITNQLFSESFDIDRKFEYEFSSFTSEDGYISLPVSKIVPFQKIIANSNGQLKIKMLTTDGELENCISGVFLSSLDPNYANNISGLLIGTDSASHVNGTISLISMV